MPLDPTADPARRAWLPCPNSDCGYHDPDCATCQAGRNCSDHWQFLLANQGPVLHLQCPGCCHLWSHDTRPAVGGTRAA